MKVAVIYHPDFGSKGHSVLKARIKPSFEALERSGLLEGEDVQVFSAEAAPLALVERSHTREHMERMRTEPSERMYHEVALLSAGSVLRAAEMVAEGGAHHSFAYTGTAGHHASPGSCWGFCYYNDVAIAIMRLREMGLARFLIVDVDPHFGDGTRNFFGEDPHVYHVNFNHQVSSNYDGEKRNHDIGIGFDADDETFLRELSAAMEMAKDFDFQICFVVFGHDSHADDYGGFELTTAAYPKMARIIKEASGERGVVFVLSGGSIPEVASKAIPEVISVLSGR
ncbi:histone deacetylase family protein [Candidatus Methanocrinis natronophilus]|uniref:Histone deacetylase n=1 Tax=Candidatus Methanocrinis natronophilus TaxID=3033396 RepID=A0ABT5X4W8_9EURY|nr:histone deacetylase [Candidatus Methanocrinis natronophilus]MDF0589715.1 histone deacetylase [Candidatus Methanocrinis natronophilus]